MVNIRKNLGILFVFVATVLNVILKMIYFGDDAIYLIVGLGMFYCVYILTYAVRKFLPERTEFMEQFFDFVLAIDSIITILVSYEVYVWVFLGTMITLFSFTLNEIYQGKKDELNNNIKN